MLPVWEKRPKIRGKNNATFSKTAAVPQLSVTILERAFHVKSLSK